MSKAQPARIHPFYEVPDDLEDTVLLQPEDAELQQGDKTIKGRLRVIQQWLPLVSFIEFMTNSESEIEFGDAQVKSPSLEASVRVVTKMSDGVRGYWNGNVELGSDHKLDKVTFHLPNYPDLYGGQDYHDTVIEGETTKSSRWSQVLLEDDGWTIALQPHRDTFSLGEKARAGRLIVLSGVGEIRRSNGEQFKKKHVRAVLEALRVFLSFSLAEWSPPLFVVGSNATTAKSWQMWANYDVTPQWYSKGWLDEHHGQHLADAYPGFCKLWKKEEWRVPLTQAVSWLIEASRQVGGIAGAIAIGQIPLEMLAWLVFVDDSQILDVDEFDKLSAANKLQLLLSHCGIPLDVPPVLAGLLKVATGAKKQMSGPRIATEVRNTIIHPHKKNRAKLPGWESQYAVNTDDLLWETGQLFKWYITLVLLSLMRYQGKYANRLTSHKLGAVEPVPWASAP